VTAHLRSLVITAESPYPPTSGVPLRNWQTINALAGIGPVDLVSIGRLQLPRQVPLVDRWEHLDAGSGDDDQRFQGYPLLDNAHAAALLERVHRMARARSPELVVLENLALGESTGALRDLHAALIFDSHNAYGAAVQSSSPGAARIRDLEARQIAAFDQVWLCSQVDADFIRTQYAPRALLAVVPNGIDTDAYVTVRQSLKRRPHKTRPTFVFIAAYWYEPNRAGAEWLIDEVLPLVRARVPDLRLLFVGASPSPRMQAAATSEGSIVVTGAVPDVRPYLAAADAVVAPIFQGGGTRFKILEAFAASLPVVSTTKGAEGLDVVSGVHALVRDDPAGFAAGMSELCENPSLANQLASAAYAVVEQRYSWPVVAANLKAALRAFDRWDLG
jgi:glycosyltransferase involved in cell wall biosynthesis